MLIFFLGFVHPEDRRLEQENFLRIFVEGVYSIRPPYTGGRQGEMDRGKRQTPLNVRRAVLPMWWVRSTILPP